MHIWYGNYAYSVTCVASTKNWFGEICDEFISSNIHSIFVWVCVYFHITCITITNFWATFWWYDILATLIELLSNNCPFFVFASSVFKHQVTWNDEAIIGKIATNQYNLICQCIFIHFLLVLIHAWVLPSIPNKINSSTLHRIRCNRFIHQYRESIKSEYGWNSIVFQIWIDDSIKKHIQNAVNITEI